MRCQSCGIPLEEKLYGKEKDGSTSYDYCRYCYMNGSYTSELSLKDMIEISVKQMIKDFNFTEDKAIARANTFIPELKRWKK